VRSNSRSGGRNRQRRLGFATGAREPGQRIERGSGGVVAFDQAAIGDGADPLGSDQAQMIGPVGPI
jgi:hypothetical protein